MRSKSAAIVSTFEDIWLLDGVRTPFAEFTGVLGLVSPIDLGIKVAREVFKRSKVKPEDVGHVFTGSMAQASYDAYVLPRHVGLYSGVPKDVPATLAQRVCGTGIEILMQAADAITLRKIQLGLCVGTESMSRNPIAAYTHRGGFALGRVEFKDFLFEGTLDTSCGMTMGDTAESLAREYKLSREEVDRFAFDSFERALAAQKDGFVDGEIAPVSTEEFVLEGYKTRGIQLPKKVDAFARDDHVRKSPLEILAKLRPAFKGVQTGGNSSGIVDGAAAGLVGSGEYLRSNRLKPLARMVAGCVVGVPPENMGIGPAAAARPLLERVGLGVHDVDAWEVNEAFGAQCLAVERELGIDHAKYNINGGAIAIGHPLAATGVRLSVTVSRQLRRSGKKYGIASACIGGGQGIALLLQNPDA